MKKRLFALLSMVALLLAGIATPAQAATSYFHVTGYQFVTSTGAAAGLGIYNPAVFNSDHSLAEVLIKNAAGDTLEFGWRKTAGGVPRLFAGHWEAGNFQGYNNADFTDYGLNATDLNADLSSYVGTTKTFTIQWQSSSGGNWWLGFNGSWVASIDDAAFSPTFTQGSEIQAFGEVASPTTANPCTDMGTGTLAAAPATGGVVSSTKYYDTSGVQQNATLTKTATHPSQYALNSVAAGTFTYGGPGYC